MDKWQNYIHEKLKVKPQNNLFIVLSKILRDKAKELRPLLTTAWQKINMSHGHKIVVKESFSIFQSFFPRKV